MTINVQTLFGNFDEEQLKTLKGRVDELVFLLEKRKGNADATKEIVDETFEELGIPKKILKRMAKAKFKESLQTEVAEDREFEALFDGMNKVK